MGTGYRVLSVGGDRAILVGVAHAFRKIGVEFSSVEPERLIETAASISPHLFLVFARPSPEDAVRRVGQLRFDARFAKLPIIMVASLPPGGTRGVTQIIPDPSDVNEFAKKILHFLGKALPQEASSSIAAPSATAPLEQEVMEIAVTEEIQSFSSCILVVDDDPSLVKLFSIALRKSGFEVLVASEGEEGFEVAVERHPDLVVADLNMPRLDGWGLLRALRADHRVGETPVIFLSAHDDYRESLKALAAGAQDYVAKGGKLESLVARIRVQLGPRDVLLGALATCERASAKIGEVGVQWALRKLGVMGASGLLQARDAFWNVQLAVSRGELVWARSELGNHLLEGAAALPPALVLRQGELLFDPNVAPPGSNVQGELGKLLDEAAAHNNQNESEALDRLLVGAKRVEIDEQLYQLYEQLGPPSCRDIAAMVREGLTPKEVMARSDRSPTEIEDTVRDLVRRRVLLLSA
jgi:DNA-binding response OmpR family regulator